MKKRADRPHILYEDENVVAVAKLARIASVPGPNIPLHKTMMGLVQDMHRDRGYVPYVLHRLDLDTSGILLFGKKAADRPLLEKIFSDQGTRKKYLALVRGVPTGSVIAKKLKTRGGRATVEAVTSYKILHIFSGKLVPRCALVEAMIQTGRKHQIRKHFSSIGHPVILDSKYGDHSFNRKFRIRFRLGRQFLHAAKLSFVHPILKKQVVIKSLLPLDLQSVLKKLHCDG